MVGPEGLKLIVNLLYSLSNTQHAQIVTVKLTVTSAGFGWMGLDPSKFEKTVLVGLSSAARELAASSDALAW